jgi:CubicO group peptidase (beta-lactamase class C family)
MKAPLWLRRQAIGALAALPLPALSVANAFVASPAMPDPGPVRALIGTQILERGLPSVVVALAHRGRIVWQEGFGLADRERHILATATTPYRIASISKALTATGLMILAQRQGLDLDAAPPDMRKPAGPLDPEAFAIPSVRAFANHTSGVAQHWQFFFEGDGERPPSVRETLTRYGQILSRPGSGYEYSNLNYALIGDLLEQRSGMSFAAFMEEEVFSPLGLRQTTFAPTPELAVRAAAGYGSQGERLRPFVTDYPGGAGAWSSAHDLIRFAMLHLKSLPLRMGPVLTEATIDAMQRPTAPAHGGRSYGIGWHLDVDRGTVEHAGYFPGASALLRLVPRSEAAVVVLTNISNDDKGVSQSLIADTALGLVIPGWGTAPPPQPLQQPPPLGAAPPGLSGRWTGAVRTYERMLPARLEIPSGPGAVTARLADQPASPVTNARFDPASGRLTGDFAADLQTSDARRAQPYTLRLDVTLSDGVLTGAVSTRATRDPSGARLAHGLKLTRD